MYGWRAEEVLGRHVWEAVPLGLSEEQRAEALRELSERGRFRTEAITYAKDGAPVYVEGITIALRDEQGDCPINGYVNIRRDVTERKRAEEELRKSHKRIENILESITEAFVALDGQWRFTYINERALDRIRKAKGEELTREELLGKKFWVVFPEAANTTIYQKCHEALRGRQTVQVTKRTSRLRMSGTRFTFTLRKTGYRSTPTTSPSAGWRRRSYWRASGAFVCCRKLFLNRSGVISQMGPSIISTSGGSITPV